MQLIFSKFEFHWNWFQDVTVPKFRNGKFFSFRWSLVTLFHFWMFVVPKLKDTVKLPNSTGEKKNFKFQWIPFFGVNFFSGLDHVFQKNSRNAQQIKKMCHENSSKKLAYFMQAKNLFNITSFEKKQSKCTNGMQTFIDETESSAVFSQWKLGE